MAKSSLRFGLPPHHNESSFGVGVCLVVIGHLADYFGVCGVNCILTTSLVSIKVVVYGQKE